MWTTCDYADRMKMLQVRNVPDDLHRRLKARAAMEGSTLSDLALGELRRAMERPTRAELLARIAARESVDLPVTAAESVRAERDAR